MSAFDTAFHNVQSLVSTFSSNIHHYMSSGYSEAEARQDFIDNFFTALGWDVRHKHQTNPYEQEVKIEKSQKQQNESARKRADYAFFIGPNYKDEVFFAEAKKPNVLINNSPQHYFQTIKYGWNSGCPVCVLTDFEEFAIIDCRQKPDIKYALNGKHKVYKYTDYTDKEKFAEIYWLFSREAVAANSIQKYAATLPKPKGKIVQKALFKGGYQAIDESFLEYIDAIRENIAKAFKKANPELNSEQLTEATQRTVDRLVFIRFLEDKFIEAEDHVSEWTSWKDFITDCRKLDVKYNGVVFKKHFIDEPHFIGADEKLFLDICNDISNLNSPYDFNYIPIHILGSIYERFLGKIVVATEKRVHIDEKPEVRKAGGVYYTPKYIVDYIVKNTVGKIIEGLTPAQIAGKQSRMKDTAKASPRRGGLEGAAPLAFADIACGSGSFLIGVYDYLLDYHRSWYWKKYNSKIKQLQKEFASYQLGKRGAITEDSGNIELRDGQWMLTLKLKQEILLNNIFGVDIDAQAVEVTQLSLFLKMLEDENVSTTGARSLFSKVLPDLSKNIVCGNSLIGWDIMHGQASLAFGEGREGEVELKKLNPMDYETAFPAVMRNGGFDAVVGNPPYVRQELLGTSKNYFKKYKVFQGTADLYSYFIEKGISLLNGNGLYGVIVANKWMRTNYGVVLRSWLKEQSIKELIDFGDLPVFKNATTYPCILIAGKAKSKRMDLLATVITSLDFTDLTTEVHKKVSNINIEALDDAGWNLSSQKNIELYKKLQKLGISFDSYVKGNVYRGVVTGYNQAFVISPDIKDKLIREDKTCKDIIKPFLVGKDVKKYELQKANQYLIFTRRGIDIKKYPAIEKHLLQYKQYLMPKPKDWKGGEWKGRKPGPYKWYEIQDSTDYYKEFEVAKIIYPNICKQPEFTFDEKQFYTNQKCYIISIDDKYLLGVLNSKVSKFLFEMMLPKLRGGFYEPNYVVFKNYPVKKINQNKKEEKQLHDEIVNYVTQILEAKKQLAAAVTESDKNFLQNKCNSLDRQIDKLVYELYGLTEEEIKIVEGV